jgi:hypothetical protein
VKLFAQAVGQPIGLVPKVLINPGEFAQLPWLIGSLFFVMFIARCLEQLALQNRRRSCWQKKCASAAHG